MKIKVNERTIRLCKRYLEIDPRNHVYVQNHYMVVESTYEREEDLVCKVLVEFLYRNYYKKGLYAFPQELLIELFGDLGFKLLRNNYAIEYAGTLHGHRMWML